MIPRHTPAAAIAAAVFAAPALAQNGLIAAQDFNPIQPVKVYQNGWHDLFTPSDGPWGLAADNATETVYYNSGSSLYSWTAGAGETNLGDMTDVAGANINFVGLTFNPNDGHLYGTRNIANEAVYQIDITTRVATVANDYTDSDYDFGGLAYDAATGSLWGASDTNPTGIYEVSGAPSFLTGYPVGETDLDGLAAYNDILYVTTDDTGDFFMLDANDLGAGWTAVSSPWSNSATFAGAAFAPWLVPAPGTAALVAFGALPLLRRRHRA